MTTRRGSQSEPLLEHVLGRETSRLLQLVRPWVCWLLLMPAAWILHRNWPGTGTALAVCFLGMLLAGLAVHLTHRAKHIGRWLSPLTVLAASGWLAAAVASGVTHKLAGWWVLGGAAICLAWNLWLAVRDGDGFHAAQSFVRGAERAGFVGLKVHGLKLHPHKWQAVVRTPPGELTADDLIKRASYIEAGARLPPNSITLSPHEDDAGWAKVTISDPRKLKEPIPWPGPSIPAGGSIAQPLKVGRWQDGEDVKYTVVNNHVQYMGSTGAGKTKSQWNEIGETVTRRDAGLLVMDFMKREQFFGVWRPALHRFETTPEDAVRLAAAIHKLIPARADHLASQRLDKWEEDCGLLHLTVLMAEAPAICKALDDAGMLEMWQDDVKAARSAGIRWLIDLQRSDFNEIPTIVRGQIDKICLGTKDGQDSKFGLSDRQQKRDCEPELWGSSQPGMSFIDSSCIPDARISMPFRFFDWGQGKPGQQAAANHASQYPAAARPYDPVTASILGPSPARPAAASQDQPAMAMAAGQNEPATSQPPSQPPARERLRLVKPLPDKRKETGMWSSEQGPATLAPEDPGMWQDDPEEEEEFPLPSDEEDLPLPDSALGRWTFGPQDDPEEWSPARAKAAFEDQLRDWAAQGKSEFNVEDLVPLRQRIGRSRPWLYQEIGRFISQGTIRKSGLGRWAINRVE